MKTIKVNSLREIDKLVAEHLFNWADFIVFNTYLYGIPPLTADEGNDNETINKIDVVYVPEYSSYIETAWKIVNLFPELYLIKHEEKTYNCSIYIEALNENSDFYATGQTAELAICLAALKVKNIEVIYENTIG